MDVKDTSSLAGETRSKLEKWQSYVDDALMKTGQVTEAAIYGLDGVKWAASKDLDVGIMAWSETTYDPHR